VRQADIVRYDFGLLPAPSAGDNGVSAIELVAPSWLGGDGMQYRLAYANPARRLEYAESRWVAPPAELLRLSLQRRLAAGAGRCRLHVDIDDMAQIFDSAETAHLVLEGRAVLLLGQEIIGRKLVALSAEAPSADAKGGVAAAGGLVRNLGDQLAEWLAAYAARCRG
jgi:cholesterol transport system auxiliary component